MSPTILPNELVDELINALQVSIDSEIIDSIYLPDHSLNISFKSPISVTDKDESLRRFITMVGAHWDKERTLFIPKVSDIYAALLKDFLLLTRLKPDNMNALLKIEPKFRKLYRNPENLPVDEANTIACETVSQISREIFDRISKGSLTIRELAEKTGLSAVAISNFKSGKDIRLSNLLKIVEALSLKMKLE